MTDPGEVFLLTAKETALKLRFSDRTLYGITEPRGRLKCVRFPGRTMYRPPDIEKYLDEMQAAPIEPKKRLQPIVRKPKRGGRRVKKIDQQSLSSGETD